MKTIHKYKLSIIIAYIGAFIAVGGAIFAESTLLLNVCVVAGVIISLVGGAFMAYYMEKYNKEIAQKNTDMVDEFIKERTQTKIPSPKHQEPP